MITYSNVILISVHLSPHFTFLNAAMSRQCFSSFVDELHVVGFSPMLKGNIWKVQLGHCDPHFNT